MRYGTGVRLLGVFVLGASTATIGISEGMGDASMVPQDHRIRISDLHNKQNNIHIQVGRIVNESHGGTSSIEIGTVGSNGVCDGDKAGASTARVVLSSQSGRLDTSGLRAAQVCVLGSNNRVELRADTEADELFIVGNGNELNLTEVKRLSILRVEGSGNRVYIPPNLVIPVKNVDAGNQLISSAE